VADFTLDVQERAVIGKKVNQLRREGIVPLTAYGPKSEPLKLQVPYRPLEVILMKAGGTNLIDLNVDGKPVTVLAREVQRNAIKGTIIHVDFFVVDQASKIRTEVPVHIIGESPAVKERRGILLHGTNTLTVEVLPSKLIHSVEVDISHLTELTDIILVSDLKLGEDITIINDPDEMLVRVSQTGAARAEDDLLEEGGVSEPEVITKGKADAEDED